MTARSLKPKEMPFTINRASVSGDWLETTTRTAAFVDKVSKMTKWLSSPAAGDPKFIALSVSRSSCSIQLNPKIVHSAEVISFHNPVLQKECIILTIFVIIPSNLFTKRIISPRMRVSIDH